MNRWVKRLGFSLTGSRAFSSIIGFLEGIPDRNPSLLRVLTYHRVEEIGESPTLYPGLISATPQAFDQQMSFLAKNFNVLSIEAIIRHVQDCSPLPPRSVLITFDDGYLSFANHAWPILKHYNLPVVLFIPTYYPDHPDHMFWGDRLYRALQAFDSHDVLTSSIGRFPLTSEEDRLLFFSKIRTCISSLSYADAMSFIDSICAQIQDVHPIQTVLDWDTLRMLSREGVIIGAHTQTHPLMDRITLEEALNEAVASQRDLEREIGKVLPIFAYPGGGFNNDLSMALKLAGFQVVFTTQRGINDLKVTDSMQLKRINVGKDTPLGLLRIQLRPWMAHILRANTKHQ